MGMRYPMLGTAVIGVMDDDAVLLNDSESGV